MVDDLLGGREGLRLRVEILRLGDIVRSDRVELLGRQPALRYGLSEALPDIDKPPQDCLGSIVQGASVIARD